MRQGILKTVCTKEVAMQVTYEYNQIRELRNHINHAMDSTDSLEINGVEEIISKNIMHLKEYRRA